MTVPCRSCRAPIFFARTPQGRTMPIDQDPHPDGNMVVYDPTPSFMKGTSLDGVGKLVRPAEESDPPPRWRSHFASCPSAGQHRRGKK